MKRWTSTNCDFARNALILEGARKAEAIRSRILTPCVSTILGESCAQLSSIQETARAANLWSVRVTLHIRVVGYREGDIIEWVWIGTHNEFDKLFG